MRLKYEKQLSKMWSYYNDNKINFERSKDYLINLSKAIYDQEKEKYERTMIIYEAILILRYAQDKWYLKTEDTINCQLISKEKMFIAFDLCIEDYHNKIESMKNLFKIPNRITNESLERVDQINSVRNSINGFNKCIEAINWYRKLIEESNAIEEKFIKVRQGDLKRDKNKTL